jgi:hypothetical protein
MTAADARSAEAGYPEAAAAAVICFEWLLRPENGADCKSAISVWLAAEPLGPYVHEPLREFDHHALPRRIAAASTVPFDCRSAGPSLWQFQPMLSGRHAGDQKSPIALRP